MWTRNLITRRPAGPYLLLFAVTVTAGGARAESPPAPPASGAAAGTGSSGNQATGSDATAAESCGSAYERAQTERLAGHYVAASEAALACSQLRCNAAIVKECVRFYESLEQDTPTLVFSARKAEGGELTNVRVEMDGKRVADQLTGRAFKVDPGQHAFVFIEAQRGQMQVSETARVGDHARVIEVTFADPFAKKETPSKPADSAPQKSHGVPAMTYVLGGVGIVGLGTFIGFRLKADNEYSDYSSSCAPRCSADDVKAVRREFLISYVSLGVGIAGLAGAGLVYVFAPSRESTTPVQATVTSLGDGVVAGLRKRF
jgi:hypothetical protein